MQKHPGSLLEGFTQTQVSTLAVKDKLLVAGGFQGELICKVNYTHLILKYYGKKRKIEWIVDTAVAC